MRVRQDDVDDLPSDFAQFLLSIGEGRASTGSVCGPGYAKIPRGMVLRVPEGESLLDAMINEVYPQIEEQFHQDSYFVNKAILTSLNTEVHRINDRIVSMLPGQAHEYTSIDTVEEQEGLDSSLFPVEFLNSLSISGMPPHKLCLKVGVPIMLLRNLDGEQGLCNGTRLQIVQLRPNCILAKILTGARLGDVVAIPRIPLISAESGLPFQLRRRQLPIMLAFAMTINKAQGQTVESLGLFLPDPVFTHGQLYVGVSRSTSRQKSKIAVGHDVHEDEDGYCILNVVFPGIAN